MKNTTLKALGTSLLSLGVAASALAQGTIPTVNQGSINFFTFNGTGTKGQVYMPGTTTEIGAGFTAQLWASDVSATSGFTALSATTASDPSTGAFNLGTIKDANDEAGSFVWYELVVWSTAAGSTVQAATGLANPGISCAPAFGTITPAAGLTAYGVSSVVRVVLGGTDDQNNVYSVPQANAFNNLV